MIIAIFPESPRIIQRGRLESSVRARGKQNNNRIEKIVRSDVIRNSASEQNKEN